MVSRKFNPKDAVEILVDQKRSTVVKTWALARLLGWICRDQRPGKRDFGSNKPRFRSENAKLTGQMALAYLIDRELKTERPKRDVATLLELIELFIGSGGFGPFLESRRGAKGILSRVTRANRALESVYLISEYLIRGKRCEIDESNRTIKYAKIFVAKKIQSLTGKLMSTSWISKRWEENKQAAPYVWTLYRIYRDDQVECSKSIGELVEKLENVTKNEKLLHRLLGEAASAADIIAENAHNVRKEDFENVQRVEPKLSSFNAEEKRIIQAIDPDQLSERDTPTLPAKDSSSTEKSALAQSASQIANRLGKRPLRYPRCLSFMTWTGYYAPPYTR